MTLLSTFVLLSSMSNIISGATEYWNVVLGENSLIYMDASVTAYEAYEYCNEYYFDNVGDTIPIVDSWAPECGSTVWTTSGGYFPNSPAQCRGCLPPTTGEACMSSTAVKGKELNLCSNKYNCIICEGERKTDTIEIQGKIQNAGMVVLKLSAEVTMDGAQDICEKYKYTDFNYKLNVGPIDSINYIKPSLSICAEQRAWISSNFRSGDKCPSYNGKTKSYKEPGDCRVTLNCIMCKK
eukprot:330079_1